jgi:hypothetical protein
MGGGTGTGASPIICQAAKELGILTVGIVTTPFNFEGKRRKQQADEGLAALKEHVDTLLVISNDKLRQMYGNLTLSSAFAEADNILATAAKGIAEIITVPGYINVDFEDVKTVMQNSGVAIMGSASSEGEGRAYKAVQAALNSPLLNDNDIEGARYILLNITSGSQEVLMDEVSEITDYIQNQAGLTADIIWGNCHDESLGNKIVRDGKKADLIIGNNVFAHVPDINDFTKGIKVLLKQGGIVTLEFPHLMRLIEKRQFDTIYHEHFSYLSLNTISNIFSTFGLRIWKVEELSTHGGSLRVYGCHENDGRQICLSVNKILKEEVNKGLLKLKTYINFQKKIEQIKDNFLSFLIKQKRLGKKIVAYGAAAKGNTLLNFSGVKPDLLPFVFDAAKSKQGKFLPGSHIPILPPKELTKIKPDFLLILPWNIINEIKFQNPWIKKTKIKLVIAVPKLLII